MKPLLAVDAGDLTKLRYPLLASYKMDGIRALITAEGPRTRSLKPVPNHHIYAMLDTLPRGLDGEIGVMVDGRLNFRATTSAVMRQSGDPEFRFFVFDKFDAPGGYDQRLERVQRLMPTLPPWVELLVQSEVNSVLEVEERFAKALDHGYEGLILRRSDAPYKHGRSTLNEHILLKVKPWTDAEAKVIEVLPEFENTNEKQTNELGRTKRSTAKAGLVQKQQMGKLVVQSKEWPRSFEIGTGFDHATKKQIWQDRENIVGQLAKFSYVTVGGYDVPRHCVFLGFRDARDA